MRSQSLCKGCGCEISFVLRNSYVTNGGVGLWCKTCVSRKSKKSARLSKYGLDDNGYNDLLASQIGVCKICEKPPGSRDLCVDHDHGTGAIRGLLCSKCNSAIGLLAEDERVMRNAIRYLRENCGVDEWYKDGTVDEGYDLEFNEV